MIRYIVYLYIILKTKRFKKICKFNNGICIGKENCCIGCIHLINNKCNIICIHCRIWFCETACQSMTKKDYITINRLYDLACKYKLLNFRNASNLFT